MLRAFDISLSLSLIFVCCCSLDGSLTVQIQGGAVDSASSLIYLSSNDIDAPVYEIDLKVCSAARVGHGLSEMSRML